MKARTESTFSLTHQENMRQCLCSSTFTIRARVCGNSFTQKDDLAKASGSRVKVNLEFKASFNRTSRRDLSTSLGPGGGMAHSQEGRQSFRFGLPGNWADVPI
jgi:hypothetical protein